MPSTLEYTMLRHDKEQAIQFIKEEKKRSLKCRTPSLERDLKKRCPTLVNTLNKFSKSIQPRTITLLAPIITIASTTIY